MSAGIRPGAAVFLALLALQGPETGFDGQRTQPGAFVVGQPALGTVLQVRQAVVREGHVLQEVLGILFPGPQPATALPLTNEPGQRNDFGCQICRNFNRHSSYLWKRRDYAGRLLLAVTSGL